MADIFEIAGRIHSTSQEEVVTVADEILDSNKNKKQSNINAEVDATLAEHTSTIQGLNSQNYETYTATDQTTAETDVLPAEGSEDTIYRLGNWDGSQYDVTCYSEYSWNGSAYVHISTKTQIGEVFDISAYHATGGELAKYADLAAALGTNGANIPDALRKGGMSVKYVSSSDNKYIQARCMAQNFTTDVTQWQGVDDEPVLDSENFVKSGGILKSLLQYYKPVKEFAENKSSNLYYISFSNLYNKVQNGCKYIYLRTYCSNTTRVLFKIWDESGNTLLSLDGTDFVYDTVNGYYYKLIAVPSGAYNYFLANDKDFADNANKFAIQYIYKDNIEDLPIEQHDTNNLLDPTLAADGLLNSDGTITTSGSYITTGFIRVKPNTTYNIKNYAWSNIVSRRLNQCGIDGGVISGTSVENVSSVTTGNICFYLRFSIEKKKFSSLDEIGLFISSITEFEYFGCYLNIEDDTDFTSKKNNSILAKKDVMYLTDNIEEVKSQNLLKSDYFEENAFYDTNNTRSSSSTYSSYVNVPIKEGSYILKNANWDNIQVRAWSIRNSSNTRLAYGENASEITAPANSAFITLSFNNNVLVNPIGLFPATAESYTGAFNSYVGIRNEVPLNELPKESLVTKRHLDGVKEELDDSIDDINTELSAIEDAVFNSDVRLDMDDNILTFLSKNNTLKCSKSSGINGVFNFDQRVVNGITSNMGDDVAPIHIALNGNNSATTIGANHGWVFAVEATVASHGKTNADIGTQWTDSANKIFVLAEIIDEDSLLFLPINTGDRIDMAFYPTMTVGNLTSAGSTLTVTSASNTQLHNSVKSHNVHVYDSFGNEVINNGSYISEYFDIVEYYEITNPSDIVDNLIARQSESPIPSTDPVFTGQGMIAISNVYRIAEGTSVVVSESVMPLQKVYINNGEIMFSQAQYLVSGVATIQHYVPGSKPTSSYDLTKPVHVDWSAQGNPSFYANSQSQQDADKPINRVIQYYPTKYGFALGFLNYAGVGKSLLNNTNNTFELRGYSGKVYPHGVEGAKIGSVINVGDCFSAVMYRVNIDITTKTTERLSYYSIDAPDGYTYLFADYAAAVLDKINLGIKYNGKAVELVESNNCSLISDVYNDGVLINASYTNNQTSYIILKIKS